MKAVFKIFLGIVVLILVLMILAAVLLPVIYDKQDLKDTISKQVRERTGRELSIAGELDFSVFPWLAVEVNELSLSNAEGFGPQPFAQIGQARVGVALIPLFRKQITVDEISLAGLDLRLVVNKQGKNNWDDLGESETASSTPAEEGPGMLSGKRIAGLNISDANVEYQDLQAGAHYRLANFSLQTGALGEGRPVPLELFALIEDLVAEAGAEVRMSATVSTDMENEHYTLDGFELNTELLVADSSGETNTLELQSPQLVLDMGAGTLDMAAFTLQLANLRAEGLFSATGIQDDPEFNGRISIAEFSPAKLMSALHMDVPATADPAVLQRAVLQTAFSGTASQMTLREFALELDQSSISGEMSIRDFEPVKIGFDFNIDSIDLDRYLEPAGEDADTAEVAMPNEELQDQDVQGSLHVSALRLLGLDFDDAEVGLVVRDGKMRINPMTARFYGGTYSGDIKLDSSGSTPLISLDEKIDSIAFQQLVSDLIDNEALSGTALGHARLTGRGDNSGEVLGSLNGDIGLTLTEGALEGINIWWEIRRAYALYKGLAAPPAEPARTVFSRMKFNAAVDGGIVQTRELVTELPFLKVSGKGAVDLGKSNVDMSLVANIRNDPELAADPIAADLAGKRIPFKISGPLADPGISMDWAELLKGEAGDMLLDRLGLKSEPSSESKDDNGQEDSQDEASLEEAAKGALFDLLSGKGKEKDEVKDDGS